jgi:hypothetical protein
MFRRSRVETRRANAFDEAGLREVAPLGDL